MNITDEDLSKLKFHLNEVAKIKSKLDGCYTQYIFRRSTVDPIIVEFISQYLLKSDLYDQAHFFNLSIDSVKVGQKLPIKLVNFMNKFDFADEMRVSIDLEDLKTVSLVIEFDDEMIVKQLSIEIDEQNRLKYNIIPLKRSESSDLLLFSFTFASEYDIINLELNKGEIN